MKRAPKLEFLMVEAKILEEIVVDERTGDKVLRAEVKWQQCNKINVNNRRYRREILEREIEALRPSVEAKEVYGCSYHPKDGVGDPHEVSHLWEKIWMTDAGECLGIVKVLPTSRGKDIQVIMHHGKIGLSSRGLGTTTVVTDMVENEKKTFEEVNDDFRLKVPGDFVLYPSVPDASVRQLMESRLKDVEDSESVKESKTMVEIKSKDELKAAYPELVRQFEEGATATARATMDADIARAVDVAHADWQTEMAKTLDERMAPLITQHEVVLETLRSVVTLLTDIEGVVPLGTVAEAECEEELVTEAGAVIKTVADLRVAYPDLVKELEDTAKAKVKVAKIETEEDATKAKTEKTEIEKIQAEKAAVEAELVILKDAQAKATQAQAIVEAVTAVLAKDEFKRVEKLIRTELGGDKPTLLIESVDKVESTLTAARDRIVATMVEADRQKIVASGLDPIGTIINPDKTTPALNEQQELRLYKEARLAGFVDTFDAWKQRRVSK